MIVDGEYQLITKDIAGARTKNRFAYEVDYGISKIYDCYLSKSDDFSLFLIMRVILKSDTTTKLIFTN